MDNLFWNRFYDMCNIRGTKPNPVAKKINISSGIVTKWKTTGTLPNGETLIKIADYLDCSVDYLLGRTDEPEIATKKAPLLSGAFEQDNLMRIAGRDGRYVEKELTKEQIQLLLKALDQLPDVPDDL